MELFLNILPTIIIIIIISVVVIFIFIKDMHDLYRKDIKYKKSRENIGENP